MSQKIKHNKSTQVDYGKYDKSTQVDYVDYVVYVMPKYEVPDYLSYYLRQFQYKPIKHNYKRKPHIIKAR